jgi:transcriptional regulator with GAF, ATPase, and Fis domain
VLPQTLAELNRTTVRLTLLAPQRMLSAAQEGNVVPTSDDINSAMRELAVNFPRAGDLDTTLGTVTAAAVTLIDGLDYADVMMIDGNEFRSVKPTDPLVSKLDDAQMRLRQGPCITAAVADSVVRCPDLTGESRWAEFAAVAVEAGVHSMLSFQLYSHAGGAGALNLFSRNKFAFDLRAEATGALLATHAAVAVMAATTYTQLHSALASRDMIGQAKGVIMERFHVDAVHAFTLLTKLSQDTNTPLRTVAQQLLDSLEGGEG